MKDNERTFNLDELSGLTNLPRRTIRYYIQTGLLAKPTGVGRGAHYTTHHLDQLLEIRKWQQAGLSLERIQELLQARDNPSLLPPPLPRKAGTVEVWSHLVLGEGIELMIEPNRAHLSPEQLRELAREVTAIYQQIQEQTDATEPSDKGEQQ
jgi:DNA-binding transcriptional MerR regulator